jgi:hypothetical protein
LGTTREAQTPLRKPFVLHGSPIGGFTSLGTAPKDQVSGDVNQPSAFLVPDQASVLSAASDSRASAVRKPGPVVKPAVAATQTEQVVLMDLESLQGDSSGLPLIRSHALPEMHVFDILKMASEHRLSIIPVVDAENNYLGSIRLEDLVEQMTEMQGANQRGGILVLEMWEKDYSMQQISRIIEENNSKILSTTLSPGEGGKIEVNLKLNQPDLNAIISSFERFGYNVKANYQESVYTEDLRKRYDELMRILNI